MKHFSNKFYTSCIKILRSNSTNIHFNLAVEQYLFESAQLREPILFLWQNDRTIVIGRHQNPWKECKNDFMKQDGVCLARRKSGGGAVYQDLGNTCFSFLTPYSQQAVLDYKTVNNELLIATLSRLGVNGQVSGRNDITVEGKKISGSAYRVSLAKSEQIGRRSLHHGTVLFSVDFNALSRYLNPNKKKLQSKGISSIVSRVMNLSEAHPHLNHHVFCAELARTFQSQYQCSTHEECLDLEILKQKYPEIKSNYDRLVSWDWLYGECPEFKYTIEQKFDWGLTTVTFDVEEGYVRDAKIYSDCLFPDFIAAAEQSLKGKVSYGREGFQDMQNKLLGEIDPAFHQMGIELCQWMIRSL